MPGPQFAHIQTWSKKPNKVGQSIDQVIDEATRVPEFSTHVADPQPPRMLLGDPSTFRAAHDAHVASRSTVVRKADGSVVSRAIRSDRHTMASIVMSYPVPRRAIETDEQRAALSRWERRNMAWLQERYGDQVKVIIAHDDEEYPHLHAWLLPDDPGADATTLHPGKLAKKQAEADAKHDGIEPREAVKRGNRALKLAMTAWQDDYYTHVGALEGLTRSGPKRRRLTREQWKAEKATSVAHAAILEKADDLEARADQLASREAELEKRAGIYAAEFHRVRAEMNDARTKLISTIEEVTEQRHQLDQRQAAIEEAEVRLSKRERFVGSAIAVLLEATDWVGERLGLSMPKTIVQRIRLIRDELSPPKEPREDPDPAGPGL